MSSRRLKQWEADRKIAEIQANLAARSLENGDVNDADQYLPADDPTPGHVANFVHGSTAHLDELDSGMTNPPASNL